MIYLTKKQILKNNLHLGSFYTDWNKKNNNYILGLRKEYTILNINYMLYFFRKLNYFLRKLIWARGIILSISENKNLFEYNLNFFKKKNNKHLIYFSKTWSGGFLTNFKHFRNRRVNCQNLTYLRKLPDSILIFNFSETNLSIINEANNLNIPIIALVNSKDNLNGVDYIIPGNNKTYYSIKYYKKLVEYILKVHKIEYKING